MTISEEIRMLCGRIGISIAELARRTGQSPQNLNSKLKRGKFTVSELEEIAKATGTVFKRSFLFDDGEEV